ncbi:tyrosine-type recombinase/integrase [Haloprofundus halobius]|uniref:tyrosine-type recombinase/integrase n=1 Tax=Haloprofundus halobius TaxID=2876194 RepID=UPI001CC9C31B|nr:tyrosine-type recombinase/integrase [Haloprofundus halobius]
MDFEEVLPRFKRRRSRNSADSTVKRYVGHVRNWREWLIEARGKQIWDADSVDLLVFIEELTDEGMAPTTISQRVSAISKFYQDMDKLAERYEMPDVPSNPYDGLDDEDKRLLRGDTKKKEGLQGTTQDEYPYLKPDEVAQLIEEVPAPRLRNELIIKLLFNCGFRRGELANCKLENVDREDNSIFIPPRKTDNSRIVSYNEEYIGFQLSQWLDYGGRESMTYAAESDYLFPTNDSIHISGEYLNQMVKETAERAGLQETISEYSDGRRIHKVTAHTLRHSFAMQAISSGIDIRSLQTLLGHDELDTTLIYLQQSKNDAKEKSRLFQPTG